MEITPKGTQFFSCHKCKLKFTNDEAWDMECGDCTIDDWDHLEIEYVKVKGANR